MSKMFALAMKDVKILCRVKPALFFTVVWPLVIAVLFGSIFGGGTRGRGRMPIALVDEDGTDASRTFATQFAARDSLDVLQTSRDEATTLVRRGTRSAAVILRSGFGVARPPAIDLLTDPGHRMEAGMLQGVIVQQRVQAMPPAGAGLAGAADSGTPWPPIAIAVHDVGVDDKDGPRSGFEVSFVQGLVWSIFGCVMGFSMSLVTERTQGTFTRLRMAPLTDLQVLGGKALACFLMLLAMQSALLALGIFGFGLRVGSPALLLLALVCGSAAFVGIMMFVASLGRTEEGTRGAGFATLMPMALFGGGMLPLFLMPAWMATLSNVSPVKWAVLAVEGAMWRGFGLADMALPCGILLTVGVAGLMLGTRNLKRIGLGV